MGKYMNYQGWVYTGAFCSGKFQGYGKFTWSENHYYQVGKLLSGKLLSGRETIIRETSIRETIIR